jgi:hypothetical protein
MLSGYGPVHVAGEHVVPGVATAGADVFAAPLTQAGTMAASREEIVERRARYFGL